MNVVFMVFNRPALTEQVFKAIRNARPDRLLIVADGPRQSHPEDAALAAEVRAIVSNVDWPCEVLRNFSDVNMGCKQRIASGLDWAFSQVEDAIILEDDCLPDPSFFQFCCELLARYRNDERVMHIGGNNFQNGVKRGKGSYYFSKYSHIWGWATWRRAWRHYDVAMQAWPDFRDQGLLRAICPNQVERAYWTRCFTSVYENKIDSWDYAWLFACWMHAGITILPNMNLVSNIGFGSQSTHTAEQNSRLANIQSASMLFPMRHPKSIIVDKRADKNTYRHVFADLPNSCQWNLLCLQNRYLWGSMIRKVPIIGKIWVRWRKMIQKTKPS